MDDPVTDLGSPFPFQVNPHAEEARGHLSAWARRTGLIRRESVVERFEHADFGWFAAMVYPTADRERLELMADWFAWLFLVDDQLDDGTVGRDLDRAAAMTRELQEVLESPPGAGAGPGGHSVAAASLAELWERTAATASASWRLRFAAHLEECLRTAATWEAANRIRGVVPDEETYIRKRRHTGAIYVCMDFVDIVEDLDVPVALYRDRDFSAALDAACDVVCWTNDVYSLEKERSLGETHNLVHVVEHHRGIDRAKALREVAAMITEATGLFLAKEAALLAAHPEHERVLRPCLAGMRSWMRGNLDWSRQTKRYRDPVGEQPEHYLDPVLSTEGR
ncbi:terpene cyclase [Kitasatospora sp. NBC_00315]|uniref:terpene synthase family protein n=1 Tax=Kitasatospora sp. NBC_00315 TaxID=2975963 RepID=UPI00324CE919